MTQGNMIGVDWGTTNARALLIDPAGAILERRDSALGAVRVKHEAFGAALRELTEGWRPRASGPVLLCGMVGSRQGWVEAPYAACPAGLEELARGAIRVEAADDLVMIAPGLSTQGHDGVMDVMRGEETQVAGVFAPGESGLVLTPGTHGKWIRVENGRTVDFKTFMTGELYALLGEHSILARLIEGNAPDPDAFARGVRRALADPALTSLLFSVRTEGLFGAVAPTALSAYLSGLLIGAEIRAGLAYRGDPPDQVTLIAAPQVAEPYVAALALAGITRTVVVDGSVAAARGLRRIATALEQRGDR